MDLLATEASHSQSNTSSIDELVELQPLTMSHANQAYVDWLNDPEVNQFLETRYQLQDLEMVKAYVQATQSHPDEYLFAIIEKTENQHIGNLKLGYMDRRNQRCWLSLFIGNKAFWGKGLSVPAIQQAIEYSFSTLGLNKICAGIYAGNKASLRAFARAGFVQEGIQKELFFDGEHYQDCILMGITRRQYQQVKRQ